MPIACPLGLPSKRRQRLRALLLRKPPALQPFGFSVGWFLDRAFVIVASAPTL
ncbi:hypothetical protein [Sorangium cellulosum]|uniref:hypothetical protein n=1 Tax=Sorangium cellulosum TaxID=56 RepID=UPI000A936065|nr:hypothetical protein [Sorangium cellulosum]